MSARIVTLRQAESDMEELARYIARHRPAAADRFLDATHETLRKIVLLPHLGSHWETDNPNYRDLRWWPVKRFRNHLIFYRPTSDGIEVLRVLHASQDLAAIFGEG